MNPSGGPRPACSGRGHRHGACRRRLRRENTGAKIPTPCSSRGALETLDASQHLLATSFVAVCDRAAGIGAQARLEFTPIGVIATLSDGRDIVRTADRSNGGLLFDTWHFFRGGPDFGFLEQIPGERIFSVPVADARVRSLIAAATS